MELQSKVEYINAKWFSLAWSLIFIVAPLIAYIFSIKVEIRNINYCSAGLSLIWIYYTWQCQIKQKIILHKKYVFVFFISILFSFLYSYISRYYAFRLNADDFGVFHTMLNAMLEGNWGYSKAVGFYHFGTHQNYILVLILPIYALFHNVETLLVLGVGAIWLTAVAIWLIAKELKLNNFLSFIIVLSFSLSPMNGLGNSFQPELFTPLFFAWLFLFYLRRQLIWFFICVLLVLMTKEDAVLLVAGFSIVLIYRKEYSYGSIALFCALLMCIMNLGIVQPYFVHKSAMLQPTTVKFWSEYGKTKTEIFFNILTHPLIIINKLFAINSGFWRLYLPFLCLPLFIPEVFFSSIMTIIMWATSISNAQYEYRSYYGININLVMFIGVMLLLAENGCFYKSLWIKRFNFYSKYRMLILISGLFIFPLIGTGWQDFWPFSYKDFAAAKTFSVYLSKSGDVICSNSNLYQILTAQKVPVKSVALSGAKPEQFFQQNCSYVMTDLGDTYPFSRDQLLMEMSRMKCSQFSPHFYICNNKLG